MKKAGGIVGLIAGIFGIIAGFATLFMGGLAGAFDASGSETVVELGWGGIGFSFLVIIFGAISISAKTRIAPTLLIASSLGGIVLGGTLVAIVLALGLIGGLLAMFGSYPKVGSEGPIYNEVSAAKTSKAKPFIVGTIFLLLLIAMVAYHNGKVTLKSETAINQQIVDLENAESSELKPYGELEQIYELGGNYTDIQRDNKTEEIKGSIVDWRLQVYDVKKTKDGYEIQTSGQGLVKTTINLTVRNAEEKVFVENLKTGDLIRVKAVIEDVSFRSVELNPAILYQEKQVVEQSPVIEESKVVEESEEIVQGKTATNEIETTELEKTEKVTQEPVLETPNMEISKPSFDCARASTNIEKMICSNFELGQWDTKVSSAYAQAYKDTPQEGKAALKAQQQEWLKVRNKCISTDCLISVHQKRHSELAPWEYEQN